MSLMSPRASRVLKTCPSRASSGAVATGRRDFARAVAIAPGAIPWAVVPSMISVMLGPVVPLIWLSLSPAIGASTAAAASSVLFPTWLCPTACTPAESSSVPSVWSPKMACPTATPVGTSGATIGSLSPMPPSRIGSRRRGKKLDSLSTTYLDEALAAFSGYLAVDEVYDGPFCILSVVDNRRYNRLAFRVLRTIPLKTMSSLS